MGGQEFVKKIRPAGAALFLIMAVLVTVLCFTSGKNPIPGYESPESGEYYAENLDALALELEENIFPRLEGVLNCYEEGGRLVVVIEKDDFAVTRSAVLRYFDKSLFEFTEG